LLRHVGGIALVLVGRLHEKGEQHSWEPVLGWQIRGPRTEQRFLSWLADEPTSIGWGNTNWIGFDA